MVNIYPSSQIGAQAYAAQLRRQYGEEETARAFSVEDRSATRASRHARRAAAVTDEIPDRARKSATVPPEGAIFRPDTAAGANPVNPTIGDVQAHPNPPARPLYSSTNREAPNPNAQLRNIRPGTHLDITI